MANPNAIIRDRTAEALSKISGLTDKVVGEFTDDAAKMAKALVKDSTGPKSTGNLARHINAVHSGEEHSIEGTADNSTGYGYTAAVDWGHTKENGRRVKGKRAILRAVTGMAKRYQRGEKWRD